MSKLIKKYQNPDSRIEIMRKAGLSDEEISKAIRTPEIRQASPPKTQTVKAHNGPPFFGRGKEPWNEGYVIEGTPKSTTWIDAYVNKDKIIRELPKEVESPVVNFTGTEYYVLGRQNNYEGFPMIGDKVNIAPVGNFKFIPHLKLISKKINGGDLAKAGLSFVPFVGTGLDIYDFVKDPTLGNLGWVGVSLASDILPFLKPTKALKAGTKAAKIAKNTHLNKWSDNVAKFLNLREANILNTKPGRGKAIRQTIESVGREKSQYEQALEQYNKLLPKYLGIKALEESIKLVDDDVLNLIPRRVQ